MTVFLPLQLNH